MEKYAGNLNATRLVENSKVEAQLYTKYKDYLAMFSILGRKYS